MSRVPSYHWWRTILFLIPAISLYTIVLGTLSLLSTLVDRSGDLGHACARAWAWLILKTTGVGVRVSGLERLDLTRSYVLASNHQSFYDIPIIFTSIPLQLRIVAKESLGRFPFIGWHLRRTGHLLVDRRNPGADIVEKMRRLVNESHSLIVFPEGTRTVDGAVGRFKRGSFVVALEAQLPVVPVTVVGSRAVMPKGRLTVCPAEIRLIVHDPVETTGLTREDVNAFAERVRTTVAETLDAEARASN